ncbi:MAG TPA: hypothetical protein DD618_00150 [Acholeplasmatales bacterium]|nr:hypothetical protein [Acholeplasmatales bacterium]
MSHYFINDRNLKRVIQTLNYDFLGHKMEFKTDSGVFSRTRIDFGTNLLINTLSKENLQGKAILDLGCGYGIIGLALAKAFPDASVEMVDVLDRAIELSRTNAELNNIKNVNPHHSDLFSQVDSLFDVIISNPPIRAGKDTVHKIVTDAYSHLEIDGALWLVIQKKQGADSLFRKLETTFGNARVAEKKNGYQVLTCLKK